MSLPEDLEKPPEKITYRVLRRDMYDEDDFPFNAYYSSIYGWHHRNNRKYAHVVNRQYKINQYPEK